ncbi:YaiO family outer membrane beta-barrel protein [Candidatus Margulisiibacteriota bacterium]
MYKKYITYSLILLLTLFTLAVQGADSDTLGINYTMESFNKNYDPWYLLAAEYTQQHSFGKVIWRLNSASRFSQTGNQLEIDAYPKLSADMYMYVNAGYSADENLFPVSRYGIELYKSLPDAFEGSLGLRSLNFASSAVTIYTAYLGKYAGNYWFFGKYYYAPSDIGSSGSSEIGLRYYFASAEDYITLKYIAGTSPDQQVSTLDIYQLNSYKAVLDYHGLISSNLIVKASIEVGEEEVSADNYRARTAISVGFEALI